MNNALYVLMMIHNVKEMLLRLTIFYTILYNIYFIEAHAMKPE